MKMMKLTLAELHFILHLERMKMMKLRSPHFESSGQP